ncbi:CPBP family intramembrane glutamic endopeptidase [Mycobacterium sp. AT1]|uniref:Rv0804 family intramembrane glutamic endopeptidase n=1 Tax=Mycobacterium sp. AT1 TaxID=1961706 RepID=UPI0018E97F3D|nr:CPBP family intramembrane glutamic endopeptidase [Mycobacterium sp. AT1]
MVLAAALVGWSLVAPKLPSRWHVPLNAGLGGVLVWWTDAPLGLRRPASTHGVRLGLRVAAAVSTTVASAMAVPAVRSGVTQRTIPGSAAKWLLIRIPIGTVWSEEAAFRAALGTVAAQSFGPRWGRVLQAAAFGMSHVVDARGAGETVVGTAAVTGAAGWVFGWLYDRTGSLAAPMLAHLAINEAGAVAAVVLQRHGLIVSSPI